MNNTNTATNTESHLNCALSLLDEVDYFLDCLIENKPIEWTDSTGRKSISTTEETLLNIQDKALFIRIEIEDAQRKQAALNELLKRLKQLTVNDC